jgi:hypothetical protein
MSYNDSPDYKEGFKQGAFTLEGIKHMGWDTPAEYVAQVEKDYHEAVVNVPQLPNDLQTAQLEFLNGLVNGAHQSYREITGDSTFRL